jgi:hypothetical protein
MKTLISILIGLFVVGGVKKASTNTNQSNNTTKENLRDSLMAAEEWAQKDHEVTIQKSHKMSMQFLQKYCYECHNEKKAKGEVNLKELVYKITQINSFEWKDTLEQLQLHDMPPKKAKAHPTDAERKAFISWNVKRMQAFELAKNGKSLKRRKSIVQISNALRDILGVESDIKDRLPKDPKEHYGYANNESLTMNGLLFNSYYTELQKITNKLYGSSSENPIYEMKGNDWEKAHYISWYDGVSRIGRRLYEGDQWLGDKFKIDLPPSYEFRNSLSIDNTYREGPFTVKLHVESLPNAKGKRAEQYIDISMGGSTYPLTLLHNVSLQPKKGVQVVEFRSRFEDVKYLPPNNHSSNRSVQKAGNRWVLSVINTTKSRHFKPQNSLEHWHRGYAIIQPEEIWARHFAPEYFLKHWLRTNSREMGTPASKEAKEVYARLKENGALEIKKLSKAMDMSKLNRFERKRVWALIPQVPTQFALDDGGGFRIHRIEFSTRPKEPSTVAKSLLAAKNAPEILRALENIALLTWSQSKLTEADKNKIQVHFNHFIASKYTLKESARHALIALFMDEKFLYSDFNLKKDKDRGMLNILTLTLWDSLPDQKVIDMVKNKGMASPESQKLVLQYLMKDEKFKRFSYKFTASFLDFARLETVAVNPNYHKYWKPIYKEHYTNQCTEYIDYIFRKNRSLFEFLKSDYVVTNHFLNNYTGKPVDPSKMLFITEAFHMYKVDKPRAGLLQLPALALAYSDGADSDLIRRGVWVRSRLLGNIPAAPPASVPSLVENKELVTFPSYRRLKRLAYTQTQEPAALIAIKI